MICNINNSLISGISACVPKKKNFNSKLKNLSNKKKYIALTGVKERYFNKNISASNLCLNAANKLIKSLNGKKRYKIFNFCAKLEIMSCHRLHVNSKIFGLRKRCCSFRCSRCSGYIYGLYLSFLLSENLKKGLLLAGDSLQSLDPDNPNLEALFGDVERNSH